MSEENSIHPSADNFKASEEYNIENLMREYGNTVLRTAYSYVKDIHTAEDLYQDIFLKVYKNLHTFHGDSSIKTWIVRITINTCKDYLKSSYNKHVVPMMDFKEDNLVSEGDYDAVEQQDTNMQIKEAVMELPEKYKDIVLCIFYQEMSIAEAAAALSIPEGTVKSRLSRAKEQLKKLLERRL